MKTGLTLTEMAVELERQAAAKRDFIVESKKIRMVIDGDKPVINLADTEQFDIKQHAHRQLGSYLKIPAPYYDRMQAEAPDLLATNVNRWLSAQDEPRMIRTLDGGMRSIHSDRYRPLDDYELAQAVLPVLSQMPVTIMSSQITETHFYMKVVHNDIHVDMPAGAAFGDGSHHIFHTQQPGLSFRNSEVGCSSLAIEAAVYSRVCTNIAVFEQHAVRKYHTGAKHHLLSDDLMHLLSDETRVKTDAALWSQVRDVVRGAFDEATFRARLDEIAGLQKVRIEGDPIKAITLTGRRFGLNQDEQSSVLRHLIEGGDLSAYGLFNAVTRTAQDIGDYDRASELEKIGGKLVELPRNDWTELAQAA